MIVIVGGGITGLTIGWELERRGTDYVVLESSERPGGVIRSAEVEGRTLDWGPQRARLTVGMKSLVEGLGLGPELVTAPRDLDLFIYRDGRLRRVPFSVGAFIRSDIVGPAAKLRLLAEPFTRGPDPAERVSAFFVRKVGRELYETVIAPLYGGLYASDPADMEVGLSLIHVLKQFGVGRSLALPLLRGSRKTPPVACSFRGGMQALPVAIASALGKRLRLETPVRGIQPSEGAAWRVDTASGDLEAEEVVLTTPAPVTARLLAEAAPESADAIGGITYNPLAVVHLDAETELRGMGFQVALTDRHLCLRGVTFNDSLFGRRNLYTAYLGGSSHPEIEDMGDEAIAELAEREFRLCTGYESRALAVRHESMPAWDVSWKRLDAVDLPRGIHLAANWWSRPGLPGRLAEAERTARMLTTFQNDVLA